MIGSLVGVQAMDVEQIKQALSVSEQAAQAVISKGFVFPAIPQNQKYHGVLPSNLIFLDDNSLGDLLGEIATWCNYANSELAKARAARDESEEKMKSVVSRLRLNVKMVTEGRKPSNPEMDDIVNSDQRTIDVKRNYLFCLAVYDYTKQLVDAAQRDWETVSRRITQRGQEIERHKRTEGAGTVPVMAGAFRRP